MQFSKYEKTNYPSLGSFTGMFSLAALFIDTSLTIPLTKSSFTGLSEHLFAVLTFCLKSDSNLPKKFVLFA